MFRWLLISISVFSQQLLAQNIEPGIANSQFSMFYANDVSAQKDMYFTNGWTFEYVHPVFQRSPFNINFTKNSSSFVSYHSVRLQYDVFTPDLHSPPFADRPFAAYLLIGSKHEYVNIRSNWRLTSELQLGIIGEAAGAGAMQNAIHEILPGASRITGWDNQIKNDVAVNYIFSLEKQMLKLEFAEITGRSSTYLGTPYTKTEIATLLRVGVIENYFNRLNRNPKHVWQLYLLGEVKGSYVLHNATIQGGLLNSYNTYVRNDLSPFVIDFQLGVGGVYKKYGLVLGQHYLTPEFEAGQSHSWGYFVFSVTF